MIRYDSSWCYKQIDLNSSGCCFALWELMRKADELHEIKSMSSRGWGNRLVDRENWRFNEAWTSKFFFVDRGDNVPTCLLCRITLAVCKQAKLQRHFRTNHPQIDHQFPPDTERREVRIAQLIASRSNQTNMISSLGQPQKQATEAFFRMANIMAKRMAPYVHGSLIKDCMTEVVGVMFPTDSDTDRSVRKNAKEMRSLPGPSGKTFENPWCRVMRLR